MSQEKIEHIKNTNAIIANQLIEAKYKLSTTEQKILHMLIAQIDFNDTELKLYSFNVSDFMSMLGTDYVKLTKKSLRTLLHSEVLINKEKSTFETNWLASAEYFKGGKIELEFSEKLRPYLIQLKKDFTKYNITEILSFKSKFSIRIYLILKQYIAVGERTLKFEELKEMLQVSELYPKYCNFKQKVLKIAYEEINRLSDLKIEYEEIKKGRKVDKIKFYITSNNKHIELENVPEEKEEHEEMDIDDLIERLQDIIDEKLKIKEYKALLQAANNDVELIKSKYQIAKKQKKIDNLVGWMVKAIQEEYSEPVEKRKMTSFNNIEGRKYNYDELERALLGQ